jgi:hypothetical protein
MTSMRPLDTPPESHRVQIEAFRRMSPDRRTAMAVEITDEVRKVAADGVRQRHPDYDAATVRLALLRLFYGDEVFRRVWPQRALVER